MLAILDSCIFHKLHFSSLCAMVSSFCRYGYSSRSVETRTLFLMVNQNFAKHFSHHLLPRPATRRRGYVATASLFTSQRRRRYVSNETPTEVSMERCQGVSVVRLHDVLLERRDDVSRGPNNDVPSVRLHDVSNKSQMKHPTTSQWYVSMTSH